MSIRTAVRNRIWRSSREEFAEALDLCESLCNSDPARALQIALHTSERAQQAGFPDMQGKALLHCAKASSQLGRHGSALPFLQGAEQLLSTSGSLRDKASLHCSWGIYYKDHGELLNAYEHLHQALKFCEATGNLRMKGSVRNSLGIIFERVGAYDTALRYYFGSLEIAEDQAIEEMKGLILSNIGSAYYQLGDNDRALEHFLQALSCHRIRNNLPSTGKALKNIAVTCRMQKDYPQALEYFRQGLEIWRQLGNRKKEADVLTNIGAVYAETGDLERGLAFSEEALACIREETDTWEYSFILSNLGWIYRQRKEYDKSLAALTEALQGFGKQGMARYENEVRRMIADVYEDSGDYRKSLEYTKSYGLTRDQLQGTAMQRSVIELETGQSLQKAEREKEEFRQQAELARREVEARMKELNTLAVGLTERNEALKKIREDLRPLLRAPEEKTRKNADRIARQIEELVGQDQRNLFQEQFEQVYQEFIGHLRELCPNLTAAEIRTCVLIKLGLSNKQIAEISFTSPLTVKTHRAHIRRKLGLKNGESLPCLLFTL